MAAPAHDDSSAGEGNPLAEDPQTFARSFLRGYEANTAKSEEPREDQVADLVVVLGLGGHALGCVAEAREAVIDGPTPREPEPARRLGRQERLDAGQSSSLTSCLAMVPASVHRTYHG